MIKRQRFFIIFFWVGLTSCGETIDTNQNARNQMGGIHVTNPFDADLTSQSYVFPEGFRIDLPPQFQPTEHMDNDLVIHFEPEDKIGAVRIRVFSPKSGAKSPEDFEKLKNEKPELSNVRSTPDLIFATHQTTNKESRLVLTPNRQLMEIAVESDQTEKLEKLVQAVRKMQFDLSAPLLKTLEATRLYGELELTMNIQETFAQYNLTLEIQISSLGAENREEITQYVEIRANRINPARAKANIRLPLSFYRKGYRITRMKISDPSGNFTELSTPTTEQRSDSSDPSPYLVKEVKINGKERLLSTPVIYPIEMLPASPDELR